MLELEQFKPESAAPEMPALKVDPSPLSTSRPIPTKPVPAPLRLVWREIRVRLLPVAAFVLAGICAVILWREWILVDAPVPPNSTFAQEPATIETGAAI